MSLPDDVQEVEANLFVVFPGWTPAITGPMSLEELMGWHARALARSKSGD